MPTDEIYLLQFFRVKPGDLGVTDMSHTGPDDLRQRLQDALLGFHKDPTVPVEQRPHRARAVKVDGFKVVDAIEVVGSNSVRKI